MKIHKEGYHIIFIAFFIIVLFDIGLCLFAPRIFSRSIIFWTTSTCFFLCIINFFRNPNRIFPADTKNIVIAPADGKIVVIEEVFEQEYFQEKKIQISIFMGLNNVHTNWIPTDGKIIHYTHHNGRYWAAYLPKASTENERSTVVIEKNNGECILIRQIAGALARRIVTYATPNQQCRINEQLGFIKFGSRVDLFLPLNADILVKLDQKVRGNQNIIARLK